MRNVFINKQTGRKIASNLVFIQIKFVFKARFNLPFVHIDVTKEGKVWIQHDGTDLRITDQLAERGIPKKQIVIGFKPPQARALMEEYAVE